MPKTLLQYADSLDERDLRWPAPPKLEPVNAAPFLRPLEGIRGITWSLYGTLLRITDGELLFHHPQAIRMEVAIEKTIHEFNMWNSMIWRKMIELLDKKDYQYDQSLYGDIDEFSQKVAYFFHSALQGIEAAKGALGTLVAVADSGLRQAALADAQCFTLVQLTRVLRSQGSVPDLGAILPDSLNTLSYEWGMKKPSISLYAKAVLRFKEIGIEPNQILHIGTRIHDDLAVAKSCGFRTVLYAGDITSLQATLADLKNPELRPDRLITEIPQLRTILQV